jgi:glycosyltransferase involved in cell wall biosynthesis
MRVAFYAPLKPPGHPVPSGDRRVGRALMGALGVAGHEAIVASRLRSWDGAGDATRQARIERLGREVARRLIRHYRAKAERRPDLWLTYHLYHKAPDWLGPMVAEALAIPYVVVEASHAPKQAIGPWRDGHAAALAAMARADALIALNSDDRAGLLAFGANSRRVFSLSPFIDTAPYAHAAPCRESFAARHGMAAQKPWLLTVAMMREGAKLRSYRVLAKALGQLGDSEWQLIIAGDGPARREVEALFAGFAPERIFFLGEVGAGALPSLYASADLYLWPAIDEAFGMAFLEAQAAGLPVVAGRERGVPDIVRDGESGHLTPPGDASSFAAAVLGMLRDASRRRLMSERARRIMLEEHDIALAAGRLDAILASVVTECRR